MISIARTFGAPLSVPAGRIDAQRVHRVDVLAQLAADTLLTMCMTCE